MTTDDEHRCPNCRRVFPSLFELNRHRYAHDRRCEPVQGHPPTTGRQVPSWPSRHHHPEDR